MRFCLIFLLAIGLFSCQNKTDQQTQKLAARIDSLQAQVSEQYKPGLGTFMKHVQMHHAKLWLAGKNQNWPLAEFEMHELKERLEDIERVHAGNDEIQPIDMIYPPLDKVDQAIEKQDSGRFATAYTTLTQTCNSCHQATDHAFVRVKKPERPPISNQKYERPEK